MPARSTIKSGCTERKSVVFEIASVVSSFIEFKSSLSIVKVTSLPSDDLETVPLVRVIRVAIIESELLRVIELIIKLSALTVSVKVIIKVPRFRSKLNSNRSGGVTSAKNSPT